MQLGDIQAIFQWWFVFFVLSLSVLPLTVLVFQNFFDKGYIFSKTLGLILLSYIMFVLGTFQVLKFSLPSLYLLLFFLFISNYGGYLKLRDKNTRQNISVIVKRILPTIVLQEVLFLFGIFFLAYIRSFTPEIHGLEKFMDYGFMNSIGRTTYFPPKDMWLTPFTINYYFFGHLTAVVLTKLSLLPAYITYNLMLASVFSLSFVGCFSLGANLFHLIQPKAPLNRMKRFLAGLLTALLVTIGGNLHTIYSLFKAYENEVPVPPWELPFLPASFPNNYWYPNATRFIYRTIHEFPSYSWVVADLHGHVFDIPVVITTVALLLSLFIRAHDKETVPEPQKHTSLLKRFLGYHPLPLPFLLLLSLMLAVMYMTNAWDGLIYFLLCSLVLLYLHSIVLPKEETKHISFLFSKDFLLPFIFSGTFVFFFFYIIFLFPFNLNFKPFVSGIGILCAPGFLTAKQAIGPFLFEADHCQRSSWWQLMILYGFFYFFIFSFLAFLTKVKNVRLSDSFVLLLVILGTFLIIVPEFIYVKDIYPAHYRANTMFKLVFQAFILLSCVSSYVIVRVLSSFRSRAVKQWGKVGLSLFLLLTLLFLTLVFIYPFQAINSYYGGLKKYVGLNGIKYLQTLYPSDYEGIVWLNKNVSGQPVILEAQGDSYTDFARVSANTGLPTVLGWTVHEWLWRNAYDVPKQPADPNTVYEVPAPRIGEVQTLYESTDSTETKRLLKKYYIEYVFLGTLERQKYPALNEAKWSTFGDKVFQSGSTIIYKIRY